MKRFSAIIQHTSGDKHSLVVSSWDTDTNGSKINIEAHNKTHNDVARAFSSMRNFIEARLLPIDTTPPTLYGLGVVIPEQFIWVFPENKFVLEGFEIPLTNGAVDIAYFQWQAFRDCLDNGNHDYLKRALMPLWDYVQEQVENQNFVVI
jgi:hypothetical protein